MRLVAAALLWVAGVVAWAQTPTDSALAAAREAIRSFDYPRAQVLLNQPELREVPAAQSLLGWLHLDHRIVPRDPGIAFAAMKRAADAGDVRAMTGMGLLYRTGVGTAVNASESKRWLELAAQAGEADALAHLGDFHQEAFATPRDPVAAQALYEQAAAAGSAYGRFRLSEVLRAPDPRRANILLRQAAEQTERLAQWRLGQLLLSGSGGISPNRQEGLSWIEQAARGNLAIAQLELAQALLAPNQLGRNPEAAFQWAQRAAQQGLAPAAYLTGRLLERGEGTGADPVQAGQWYQRAAQGGVLTAWAALANLVASGKLGTQDFERAATLAQQGAQAGDPSAQVLLAQWYEQGRGVVRSATMAHAWTNVALGIMASLNVQTGTLLGTAQQARERIGAQLDAGQLAQAQALARDWRSGSMALQLQSASDPLARAFRQQQPPLGQSLPAPPSAQASVTPAVPGASTLPGGAAASRRIGSGSGFFVSDQGHLVTNQHVVQQCTQVRLAGQSQPLIPVGADAAADLAVLRTVAPRTGGVARIRSGPARQGEDVITYGFPLQGLLAASGQIATGIVAAMEGLRNDGSQLQINAPVQPGSSGGPVLDRRGEVIGVVVSKLNALRVAQNTGDIPQNVNFAIKPEVLRQFLQSQNIALPNTPSAASSVPQISSASMTTEDLAERARQFTVAVECWR
jgi:hypothetical protein